MTNYFSGDLRAEIEIPEKGLTHRVLHDDERVKAIVYGLARGHVMPPHAAPKPAMLYFVSGTATLTLGNETKEVEAGAFTHMAPNLIHGITAHTDVVLLLIVLKS